MGMIEFLIWGYTAIAIISLRGYDEFYMEIDHEISYGRIFLICTQRTNGSMCHSSHQLPFNSNYKKSTSQYF